MNKKTLKIILGISLIIAGCVVYLAVSGNGKQAKKQAVVTSTVSDKPASTPANATAEDPASMPGKYVEYSSDVIASTKGTKLLFFHAPWCPQCRAIEADIKEDGVPSGVTIIKVDYDTNQALRQKYGVTIQTTIVRVDDNGALVKKYVAYDEPTLNSVVKNLL